MAWTSCRRWFRRDPRSTTALSGRRPRPRRLHLVNVGGTLFFAAEDGELGRELWKVAPPEGDFLFAVLLPGDRNGDGVVDERDRTGSAG